MTRHPLASGCSTATPRAPSAAEVLAGLARDAAGGLARAVSLVHAWQERAAMRYRLMELDERMLKDIGLSRADALSEGEKPFWRP